MARRDREATASGRFRRNQREKKEKTGQRVSEREKEGQSGDT